MDNSNYSIWKTIYGIPPFLENPIYWGGKINISETNKQLKEAIGIYQ